VADSKGVVDGYSSGAAIEICHETGARGINDHRSREACKKLSHCDGFAYRPVLALRWADSK